MVGGIDADRESIHGLARPGKLVELRHQTPTRDRTTKTKTNATIDASAGQQNRPVT